ncbi:hypothetical protein K7W42_01625 [Deinococcus sp. HMF7604]|uniref:WD40 repeat domain-containing protein n=1 Tax=Deinococcus betulae TaxID=2873312 RepID=UPI001CCE2521|nr:hypothetical protein [Deinococcus betulae]MBZ9749554.1 hypothetical protein [Deinococcus betulae]
MLRCLILAALLTSSALAGLSQPEDRLAASLGLPAGSYEAALRVESLGLNLWPGSLRLKDPALLGSEQQALTFDEGPAFYGLHCQDAEVYHAPAVFSDFAALRAALFDLPGVVGLGDDGRGFLFRRAATFGWLQWGSGALRLNVCQTEPAADSAATFAPLLSVHQGAEAAAPVASATGLLAWCSADQGAWQRQLALGSLGEPAVSPDGRLLAVSGFDPRPVIFVLSTSSGETLHRLSRPNGTSSLSFAGDSQSLLAQDFAGTYTLLDTASGQVRREWSQPGWGGFALIGGGASRFIQTGSRHQPLRVIDAATGKITRTLNSMAVSADTLTPDGLWAVTLEESGKLSAYRAQDASAAIARKADHTGTVDQPLDLKNSPAALLPGRHPDSVLILVQTPRLRRVQVLEWQVGTAVAASVLTLNPGEQLTMNRATGTLTALPTCLP